jgi:hypothetical protein
MSFPIGVPIFDKLAETQSEFESQYKTGGILFPFPNLPNFYVQFSICPRKIGHGICPKGEFSSHITSHSLKLTGFKKTLNWAVRAEILGDL